MPSLFLTAEWRKLILANYLIEPALLRPFLPARTELDQWQGNTYISLVGFMFKKVRIRGISVPYHTCFPEVNLRFYVRHKEKEEWKRGVVFISEIVPRPAITWIANTFFKEHYTSLPMRHFEEKTEDGLLAGYKWKFRGRWDSLSVNADPHSQALAPGSSEEFITEHFWGYSAGTGSKTVEYRVEHPRWDIYKVRDYRVECDFKGLYGSVFAGLAAISPESVFFAEGSKIGVYNKKLI